MKAVGLGLVEEYITRYQNTVTQYVFLRPILEIYMGIERMAGFQAPMRWWEHVGVYIMGASFDMTVTSL